MENNEILDAAITKSEQAYEEQENEEFHDYTNATHLEK